MFSFLPKIDDPRFGDLVLSAASRTGNLYILLFGAVVAAFWALYAAHRRDEGVSVRIFTLAFLSYIYVTKPMRLNAYTGLLWFGQSAHATLMVYFLVGVMFCLAAWLTQLCVFDNVSRALRAKDRWRDPLLFWLAYLAFSLVGVLMDFAAQGVGLWEFPSGNNYRYSLPNLFYRYSRTQGAAMISLYLVFLAARFRGENLAQGGVAGNVFYLIGGWCVYSALVAGLWFLEPHGAVTSALILIFPTAFFLAAYILRGKRKEKHRGHREHGGKY